MAQSTPGVKAPPPAAAAAAGVPALLSPAEAAQVLGVAESDVLASLEAGDLKGKRIGSQWRITRAAIDSFLAS
jgi:excisionase family DNA binding protein